MAFQVVTGSGSVIYTKPDKESAYREMVYRQEQDKELGGEFRKYQIIEVEDKPMSNIKPLAPYARDIVYYIDVINNHSAAVSRVVDALSGFCGHLRLMRAIENVGALERFYGYMPESLIAIRNDIHEQAMKLGRQEFGEAWRVIEVAFNDVENVFDETSRKTNG